MNMEQIVFRNVSI